MFEYVIGGGVVIMVALFGFALYRGRRVPGVNDQIVRNQEKLVALNERSALALERIADALEKR